MRRAFRFLLWAIAVLTAALGGLAGYIYTHQDELKAAMLGAVNEHLDSPVQIGGLEVDLWGRFPDVSLRFDEVLIPDPQIPRDSLAYAASIYAQFDLIKAVRGTYVLQRITLKDGRLKLRWNEDGTNNYSIFKDDSSQTPQAAVQLDGVTVLNSRVTLSGHGTPPWSQTFLAERIRARGSLKSDAFSANLDWELWVPNLAAKPIRIEGNAQMQGANGSFEVPQGELNVAGWPLALDGKITGGTGQWNLHAEGLDVAKVIALIPAALLPDPETLQLSGTLKLDAKAVTTAIGSRISATGEWTNGRLQSGPFDIREIRAAIKLDNGAQARAASTALSINVASASATASSFQGRVTLQNLDAPLLDVSGTARVGIAEFLQWMEIPPWEEAQGTAEGSIGFRNQYRSLDDMGTRGVDGGQWAGNLALSPGVWRPKGASLPLNVRGGTLSLEGANLKLDKVRVQIGASDASISGSIKNALNEAGMIHDLAVTSRSVNATEIMATAIWNADWTGPSSPSDPPFNDPYRVELRTGKLTYNDVNLADVQADIVGRGRNFTFRNTLAQFGGGQVRAQGTWSAADPDGGHLRTTVQLQRVRINTVLRELQNFNQNALTADQIDGILDANVTLELDFDANYDWDPASLIAEVGFNLEGGRLRNVDALKQLARFAEVEDLNDVRFAPVRNTLYISQSRVLIPEMLLENNALQLKIGGTHSFSQHVDYRIQLQLRELLGSKKPKRSRELDSYIAEESSRGPVWVPIRATGPMDRLTIKLDGQSLKEDVKTSVKQDWERQAGELKSALKPTEYQTVAPEKKYQFEWDDSGSDTTRSINEPERSRSQPNLLRRRGGGG